MGELIVQGNGKEYIKTRPISLSWILWFVVAGAVVVIGFLIANRFGFVRHGGGFGGYSLRYDVG